MRLVRPRVVLFLILCSVVAEAVVLSLLVVEVDLNRAAFEKKMELGDNSVPPSHRFQIFDAINRGSRQKVQAVLKRKPEAALNDERGRGAENLLEHAAYKGDVAIMTMLLDHSIDGAEAAPISAAAAGGSDDAIEFLAGRGYEINIPPKPCCDSPEGDPTNNLWRKNHNPVWSAVLNDQPVSILTLARLGARLDLRDSGGATSLHLAATRGSMDVILALLRSGADPSWTNNRGQTPAQCAATRGRDIVALLLRSWCDASEPLSGFSGLARELQQPKTHTAVAGVNWENSHDDS